MFCNNREREAIREAKSLFDQYGPLFEFDDVKADGFEESKSDNERSSDDCDIDEALEKETKQIKEASVKSEKEGQTFQLLQTGVQNVLFFRTKIRNPLNLAMAVMKDIKSSGAQKTRHLLRMIPVDVTCKAYDDNVKEACLRILPKHFKDREQVSFSILFKSRCNQSFSKDNAVKLIGGVVRDLNPKASVEYKNPDLVIIVEVMKGNCCLGVLPDYFSYKKYNLVELAKGENTTTEEENTNNEKN